MLLPSSLAEAPTLLAFMPPNDGGWALVAIDATTGAVSATRGLSGLPPLRVRLSGTEFLTTTTAMDGGGTTVLLHAAFAAAPNAPSMMLSIDVACALAPPQTGSATVAVAKTNCTVGASAWPINTSIPAPGNLAVWCGSGISGYEEEP